MKKKINDSLRFQVNLIKKSMATSLLLCVLVTTHLSAALLPIHQINGRIAISHDGNKADLDDIMAVPMQFAILSACGVQNKLVHFDINDNLGAGGYNTTQYRHMMTSLAGRTKFPGFNNSAIFFDCQTQLNAAIANFKKQAELGSATNILNFICAGPMEVPWRMINAVAPEKRKYIRVISHSVWNNTHVEPGSTHTLNSIRSSFGKDGIMISDLDIKGLGSANWSFLKNMPSGKCISPEAWSWITTRDVKGNGDVSDAVMTWYLLTGVKIGIVTDFQARFMNPICKVTAKIQEEKSSQLQNDQSVLVYPNPVSNILNIDLGNSENIKKIKIFNTFGQVIYSVQTANSSAQIDIKSLKLKGVVLVQVVEGSSIYNKKVIIK